MNATFNHETKQRLSIELNSLSLKEE